MLVKNVTVNSFSHVYRAKSIELGVASDGSFVASNWDFLTQLEVLFIDNTSTEDN